MQRRTRQQLRTVAFVTLGAALAGAGFGLAFAGAAGSDAASQAAGALRGVWTGAVIAFLLTVWEVFYVNRPAGRWIIRRPFLQAVGLRSVFYLAVIVFGIWSGGIAVPIGDASDFGWNASTAITVGFSVLFSVAVNFAFAINRLLGQAVFQNFLTGRYHRPVEETRILLFADLAGSTGTAERIGNLAFHRLLNDVYRDLTAPVIELGGTIHKYVGDEMIVSWRDTPENRKRAVQCGAAFNAVLGDAGARYLDLYGLAPAVRVGIHAGPVVVGEMGDVRQEIVFLGDAMNMASRLVDMCRTLGRPMLVSEALLNGGTDRQSPTLTPVGETTLRGKTRPVAIYAPAE